MNRKHFSIVLLFALFAGSMLVPVLAMSVTTGITLGSLPISDPMDDIYKYNSTADPYSSIPGDYHDEIDIKQISLNGDDLVIELYAVPIIGSDYFYMIYISNDTDDSTYEFSASASVSNVVLYDWGGQLYWNGTTSSWTSVQSNCSFAIVGKTIVFQDVVTALPNIASYKFAAIANYLGDIPTWWYRDRADGSNGSDAEDIPGFTWIPLGFNIITLIGLILFLRKQKISF